MITYLQISIKLERMEKMNIKKVIFSGAVLGLSSLVLGACGNSNNSSGDDSGSKEITFMFRGGEDEKKAYETAIK
ncbi:hypothetical protein HMPREF9087_0137 [Enterococcus casseliflavus ATCC 12755]|uniref:Uncharacterized protein n=1 Tax=Enterococcus casseliflavus ATCC 12755 TaxID=888066 RepID=F0EG40_ENTCA|nr:hypothetical protein HMPREF9087_0137 [Enterococcus casseliflavus ATCC 12755]